MGIFVHPGLAAATPLRGSADEREYRKELLVRFQDVIDRGGWEGDLHDAMKEHGVQLHSQPSIRVGHKMHYTVSAYSGQRFLYSRSYAALRLEGLDRMPYPVE